MGQDERAGGRWGGFLCLLALSGALVASLLSQGDPAGENSPARLAARSRQMAIEQAAARGDVALSRSIAAHADPPQPSHCCSIPDPAGRASLP
jgi:hypothetical protein